MKVVIRYFRGRRIKIMATELEDTAKAVSELSSKGFKILKATQSVILAEHFSFDQTALDDAIKGGWTW